MRKDILESAWLHYTLLVLFLAGATTGGLVLLGCDDTDPDAVVPDDTQRYPDGGVVFLENDSRTEARVNLRPKLYGQPVKWYKPKGQPYLEIPDPSKSNEVVILRPPDDLEETEVTVEGDFQKDGKSYHVSKHVHVENSPRPK
jgi:hypothetical protein